MGLRAKRFTVKGSEFRRFRVKFRKFWVWAPSLEVRGLDRGVYPKPFKPEAKQPER